MAVAIAMLVFLLGVTSSFAAPEVNVSKYPGYTYLGSFSSEGEGSGFGIRNIGSYWASSVMAPWNDAYSNCLELGNGAHLLSIETAAEDEKVKSFMIKARLYQTWTDAVFDSRSTLFKWASTGAVLQHTNWDLGEPYYSYGSNVYVTAYSPLEYFWRTTYGGSSISFSYICETNGAD